VSMAIPWAATSTDSTVPTFNCSASVAAPPTSTTTSLRSSLLKPAFSTTTLYKPGGNTGTLNTPAPVVVTLRNIPLATLVTVTVAPGTRRPLGSTTVPLIAPAPPED